ncbi:MAG: hypothetical protein IT289_12925 [Oligoflexia bacterium]|nr:hypothetical protein [Oligoflexia bacterium]
MIIAIASTSLAIGLFGLFCIRHFLIQILSMKLVGDCLLILLNTFGSSHVRSEMGSYSWVALSIQGIVAFLVFVAGIKNLSKAHSLRVWGEHE